MSGNCERSSKWTLDDNGDYVMVDADPNNPNQKLTEKLTIGSAYV